MLKRYALVSLTVLAFSVLAKADFIVKSANRPHITKPAVAAAAGGGDAHIVWYSKLDSVSSPLTPDKGSGNLTIPAGFLSTPFQVGNGADGGPVTTGGMTVATSGLLSGSEGAVAFYWVPHVMADGHIWHGKNAETNPQLNMRRQSGASALEFYYNDSLARVAGLTAGTTYYVTAYWSNAGNTPGNTCYLEIFNTSGVSIGSDGCGATTGGPPTLDANYALGGTNFKSKFDQYMFSDNPTQNFVAIRDSTSP